MRKLEIKSIKSLGLIKVLAMCYYQKNTRVDDNKDLGKN